MLGWSITVYRYPTNTILAGWRCGLGGLDWLDTLVARGEAKPMESNGYPTTFLTTTDVVLPLLTGDPLPVGSPLAQRGTSDRYLNHDALEQCPLDEWALVEAWDQS